MLITAQYLVDRLRHPRSRADEVAQLRRRFATYTSPSEACAEEVTVATELRHLRQALGTALGEAQSCSRCARGHPLPHGRWSGGHCCGCPTDAVFTDNEVGALRLGGTTAAHLLPPVGDNHAGCAFRGPTGCSLAPVDRPNICVRYICRELDEELVDRGDRRSVRAIAAELRATFDRWTRLRASRRSMHSLGCGGA